MKEKSRVGLSLCSFAYKERQDGIESITIKAVFANSEFNTESMDITKKTLHSMEPFSFQVDRSQYRHREIEVDGEIFYEYTVNCCLALISIATNYPLLHDNENPEVDSDNDWETDEED